MVVTCIYKQLTYPRGHIYSSNNSIIKLSNKYDSEPIYRRCRYVHKQFACVRIS